MKLISKIEEILYKNAGGGEAGEKAVQQGGEMNSKIIAKIALGLPLTKKEQAVYELIIRGSK